MGGVFLSPKTLRAGLVLDKKRIVFYYWFMKNFEEKSVYIKVIEYAYTHNQGFFYKDILTDTLLKLNDAEKEIVKDFLDSAYDNKRIVGVKLPTPFNLFKKAGNNEADSCIYNLSYEAYFDYLGYIELQEARKASYHSTVIAIIAIAISAISFFINIYSTSQPIKIDKNQIQEMVNSEQSLKN